MSYLDLVLEELAKLHTRLKRLEDKVDTLQETLAEVRANQPVTGKVEVVGNPFRERTNPGQGNDL
jgi:hypothetical protein